jgi:arginine decarboxylase
LRAAYADRMSAAGIVGDEAARLVESLHQGLIGYTYLAETP